MTWLIGVDVGGTFTDFFAYHSRTKAVRLFKIPSTPSNPAAAIVDGFAEMCKTCGIDPSDVERLCHGTTADSGICSRSVARRARIFIRCSLMIHRR